MNAFVRAFQENDIAPSWRLRLALDAANDTLGYLAQKLPVVSTPMGTTLVAAIVSPEHLYWISVGDSPLFLYRSGKLERLNEDHSLTPLIEQRVRIGEMSQEEADHHPDRHTLQSALRGQDMKINSPRIAPQYVYILEWWSGNLPLLPFYEQGTYYDTIVNWLTSTSVATFPVAASDTWQPWRAPAAAATNIMMAQVPTLRCPSDWRTTAFHGDANRGTTNYMFCVGDVCQNVSDTTITRGIFGRGLIGGVNPAAPTDPNFTAIKDITDGTSKTILMSERIRGRDNSFLVRETQAGNVAGFETSPIVCSAQVSGASYTSAVVVPRAGRDWMFARPAFNGFNTISPPNGPACNSGNTHDFPHQLIPPTSYHPGGANAVMADASVRFITDNIDTGNLSLPNIAQGPSPYGVWGAMGTKAGGEVVNNE